MRATHKKILASLLVLIMVLSVAAPAFAASPLEVEVPVKIVETGSVAPGKTYQVVLKANDPSYPMPDGSLNGEFVLTEEVGSYKLPITFSEVGFYYYTIYQKAGTDPLADYDDTIYDLTVFISFAEDGSLESAVVLKAQGADEKQDEALFENDWTPIGNWAPMVTKELTGRDMEAGEFSFTLSDMTGVIQTKKNDADRKVMFDEITFMKPGVYKYTLLEKAGDAYAVEYDETVYSIELTVTDNGDGTLSFKPSYDEENGIVFKNTFKIPTTDITVTKKWVGGPQVKPVIQLQLYRDGEAYGEVVELDGVTSYTWQDLDKTDAEGKEYVYTVQETVVPNDYEVSYSEDGLTVTNTWVKAELPKTGMGSSTSLLVTGMGLLMVTVYLGFKRRRDD